MSGDINDWIARVNQTMQEANSSLAKAIAIINDLDTKFAIATENAAQAMKERDLLREEVFNINHAMYTRTSSLMTERDHWQAEAQKWRRIRTPTHGTCCTCQGCGQSHEDCKCSEEELEDALNQACKERDELRKRLAAMKNSTAPYLHIGKPSRKKPPMARRVRL